MSCALVSPENGVCANRRPVNGRSAIGPVVVRQASLTPLAEGHSVAASARPKATPAAARAPFTADAPESTFSLAQVLPTRSDPGGLAPVADLRAPSVRTAPPSYRDIRAGRAAAAMRAPVAEVRIPLTETEGTAAPAQRALPGMDQLVERVRQRTAARISRAGTPHLV